MERKQTQLLRHHPRQERNLSRYVDINSVLYVLVLININVILD